jgi:hypothetical protein
MKGLFVLLIMFSIVGVLSIIIRRLVVSFKSRWAYIILPIYILIITGYLDFLFWLTDYLREKKIYLDMGHADIGIFLLGVISYFTALCFIINIIFVRYKKWKYN